MQPNALRFSPALTVRFENAPGQIDTYLREEFGDRWRTESGEQPLITVLFERLTLAKPIRFIGARSETSGERFFLLDPNGARLEFDFGAFDGQPPFRLTAEPTIRARFFLQCLEHLLRALAPKRESVFVHSSGFSIENRVILIPAWGHTGKTNTLLTFLKAGADYYGDDWCLLSNGQLVAYPKRLNLFGYNFKQFPELRSRLALKTKLAFSTAAGVAALLRPIARRSGSIGHYAGILAGLFDNQGHVRVRVDEAVPTAQIGQTRPLTHVFLPQQTEEAIAGTELPAATVAKRMVHCLAHERAPLFEWYHMFRFAFPDRASHYIDGLAETEQRLLERQFTNAKTFFLSLGNGRDKDAIARAIRSLIA